MRKCRNICIDARLNDKRKKSVQEGTIICRLIRIRTVRQEKDFLCFFDDGIYSEINSMVKEKDALTGVISAYGYVNGNAVYAFSQDKSLNSGAVGRCTG